MKINSPPLLDAAPCPECKAIKLGPHPQREGFAFCAGCGFWSEDPEDAAAAKKVKHHRELRKGAW